MKEWREFIQAHVTEPVWAYAALDWFYRQQLKQEHSDPERYMDLLLDSLDLSDVDPREFHRALLCVAVQLLGFDFDAITSLSCKCLRQMHEDVREEHVNAAASDYAVYGRSSLLLPRAIQLGILKMAAPASVAWEAALSEEIMLRRELNSASPPALPYFISVYLKEGQTSAEALHSALKKNGFLCSADLDSGDDWRLSIESGLRGACTLFTIETENYHTRPYCRLEALFAIAAGYRLVRVGCIDRPRFDEINTLQYSQLIDRSDPSNVDKVLKSPLPRPQSTATRKLGAHEIVKNLPTDYLLELAAQLNIDEFVSPRGNDSQIRREFVQHAFMSPIKADMFCKRLDFTHLM